MTPEKLMEHLDKWWDVKWALHELLKDDPRRDDFLGYEIAERAKLTEIFKQLLDR